MCIRCADIFIHDLKINFLSAVIKEVTSLYAIINYKLLMKDTRN